MFAPRLLFTDGHLDCFYVLATVNSAAMDTVLLLLLLSRFSRVHMYLVEPWFSFF